MKQIRNYINERLHVTTKSHVYSCQPQTKDELQEIIIKRIEKYGLKCDLNDIDVSKITDMESLFNSNSRWNGHEIFSDFNGDISLWDVSNVKDMSWMFRECGKFNGDISQWDVSNVKVMSHMFMWCGQFNCDISQWDVSNVEDVNYMFYECKKFDCDLSGWDVSNVKFIYGMFKNCEKFKGDRLNKWNLPKIVNNMYDAFGGCATQPKWYKE